VGETSISKTLRPNGAVKDGVVHRAVRFSQRICTLANRIRQIGTYHAHEIINTLEYGHGHLQSFRRGLPVDAKGAPLPWYTYPSIEYLQQLDFCSANVFEFGSGNGSLYWSSCSKRVRSVESDAPWYARMRLKAPSNLSLVPAWTEEEYVESIHAEGTMYSVIVVDGIYRLACAEAAVQRLANGGMIILDNSDWFVRSAKVLREANLIQVDFTGFGPVNYHTWTTSLFLSRDFSFRPRNANQPSRGVGSILMNQIDE
jgi:hypothetical protein